MVEKDFKGKGVTKVTEKNNQVVNVTMLEEALEWTAVKDETTGKICWCAHICPAHMRLIIARINRRLCLYLIYKIFRGLENFCFWLLICWRCDRNLDLYLYLWSLREGQKLQIWVLPSHL